MKIDKKTIVIAIVAIIILVIGVISLTNRNSERIVGVGAAGNLLAENYDPYIMQNGGFNTALPINTSNTLSVTGVSTFTATPVFSSGVATFNGVDIFTKTASFQSATTTLCYVQNSSTATSTPIRIAVRPTVGTTTASAVTLTFATSTTQYASTSPFTGVTLPLAWNFALQASSTPTSTASGSTGIVLGPSNYLVVKISGDIVNGGNGIGTTGTCTVGFMQI
jgi:hypothetical protein